MEWVSNDTKSLIIVTSGRFLHAINSFIEHAATDSKFSYIPQCKTCNF